MLYDMQSNLQLGPTKHKLCCAVTEARELKQDDVHAHRPEVLYLPHGTQACCRSVLHTSISASTVQELIVPRTWLPTHISGGKNTCNLGRSGSEEVSGLLHAGRALACDSCMQDMHAGRALTHPGSNGNSSWQGNSQSLAAAL